NVRDRVPCPIAAAQDRNRRLVEHEAPDARVAKYRFHGADPAVGMADHVDGAAVDDRGDGGYVRELVSHAIGRGVPAAAAAAPIHGVDGEMALQRREDGSPAAVVRGGSVNQQNRRAMAAAKIADRGAVFGLNGVHARSRGWHYRARAMAASPARGRNGAIPNALAGLLAAG